MYDVNKTLVEFMYILTPFQVHDLEFAQIENEVVQGLKKGNESLKKLHQVCFYPRKRAVRRNNAKSLFYLQYEFKCQKSCLQGFQPG